MVTFDDVLPTLVQTLEASPGFESLRICAVVRDLHGKVRIVVDDAASPMEPLFDKKLAERSLAQRLRGYFVGPIWSTGAKSPDEARLARSLLERVNRLETEIVDQATGERRKPRESWRMYERRISKNAWLDQGTTNVAWPIEEGPCVTAFYSFKGGIGRTTALASCAWQLAEEGKRVVVLDLDLEAPGIGTLLEVNSARGLLDLLVDCVATGDFDLEGACAPASVLEVDDRVMVLPAGTLDGSFVEKLARLDFSGHGADDATRSGVSPVEQALRAILGRVRGQLRPDHILLDARSGIHDLSGLSLHRLAHTDVLLSRAGEQSYQGFELTLRSLIRRKGYEKLQCVVVHSMATPGDFPSAIEERDEFRRRVYKVFSESLYSRPGVERPPLDNVAAPHQPFVIPFNQELMRFGSIKSQRENLTRTTYRELHERITTLATVNSGVPDDEN